MSRFLSIGRFKWVDPKEFDSNKYNINNSKGFPLEVHLEYPKKLHRLHNDYPLARRQNSNQKRNVV